ncbi:uncharacterized protein LOC119021916 [Acanthopagrus latus]|uniref:uncharacterized protein LOC119021916 n=1 Tax=Acanthopagrus latus TaxID=8177 RepID=UPI00187C1D66|nr:uncharacterized protein LOC119021916 [Acanthopagrus latus]
MGSGCSQEDCDRFARNYYQVALEYPCLLPDIGIDESLLKYSGIDSNAVLQTYSNELINSAPGFIDTMGSRLSSLNSVPNAVGLGALVISMVLEIVMKSTTEPTEDTYSLLRRVFGEEKRSAVRDTMSEYVRRHHTFMSNEQRLREELRRLEAQLSNHLTILRNSLLYDGQMTTRGFKIWINGASFHLQMLIHEAQLNIQAGRRRSDYVTAINAAISLYLQNLDVLLEKYKNHNTYPKIHWVSVPAVIGDCVMASERCEVLYQSGPCGTSPVNEDFRKLVFSKFDSELKSHFSYIRNNLNSLINQRGSFTLPSASS